MNFCHDCSSTHMGGDCGMSWKERVGTSQVSAGAKTFPQNYYDNSAVDDTFGGREGQKKILEETQGVGTLRWRNGEPYKRNRLDGSYERANSKDINSILSGPEEIISPADIEARRNASSRSTSSKR